MGAGAGPGLARWSVLGTEGVENKPWNEFYRYGSHSVTQKPFGLVLATMVKSAALPLRGEVPDQFLHLALSQPCYHKAANEIGLGQQLAPFLRATAL